jgi:hypothetical protein
MRLLKRVEKSLVTPFTDEVAVYQGASIVADVC